MLSLVALAVAAASPAPSPELSATAPWWEKIVMTLDEKGTERACSYESSLTPEQSGGCESEPPAAAASVGVDAPAGVFTKLTFERRFSPGNRPDMGNLQPGDTLLGGQIIALSIDGAGEVTGCRVVASSGDMETYGCDEAKAEKFVVRKESASAATSEAFMTILVYGHMEQVA